MTIDIYTIGHSTHSEEKYISLLKAYQIEVLIDVRSYPGSRYMPQFNKEDMVKWVTDANIKYIHMPALGGRRRVLDSIDDALINGWDNIAFKNYAAYSLTAEYAQAIEELIAVASKNRVCYMCAESVPWRCHRLLISNTLVAKGLSVHHIISETKTIDHTVGIYGAKPELVDDHLVYPK